MSQFKVNLKLCRLACPVTRLVIIERQSYYLWVKQLSHACRLPLHICYVLINFIINSIPFNVPFSDYLERFWRLSRVRISYSSDIYTNISGDQGRLVIVSDCGLLLVERALEVWDLHIVYSYRAQTENYTDGWWENNPDSSSLGSVWDVIHWSKGDEKGCLSVYLVYTIVIHVILGDDFRLYSQAIVDTSSWNIYIWILYDHSPQSLNIWIVISTIKHRNIVEIWSSTWASLSAWTQNRNFTNIARRVSKVLTGQGDFGSKISRTLIIWPWVEHVVREIHIKDCFIHHVSTWDHTDFNESGSPHERLVNRDSLNDCLLSNQVRFGSDTCENSID